MGRRSFLFGGLAVTAPAVASRQAEALDISTNDLYINSFIRQNPDLKSSVLGMVRTNWYFLKLKRQLAPFTSFRI